jgi:hypothetical protein
MATDPTTIEADALMRHGDEGGTARRTVTFHGLTDVTRDGDVILMDSQGRDVARIPSYAVTALARGSLHE